ncbi:MAG: PhzF family phenazine biosynthesis protein [Clostridia bacterium]|nr:PhzF family phenazine biosynthesis protein [Clostridia bacterium]
MRIPIFQVDAFADKVFRGNPAAVCPLTRWPDDALMQQIAKENNVSETAFFVKSGNVYHIRWFTPTVEVDLCGHATLASAHILFEHLNFSGDILFLTSRSGDLRVKKQDNMLVLDFPAGFYEQVTSPILLKKALGKAPLQALQALDYLMAVYDDVDFIKNLKPDFQLLRQLPYHAVIVTAPGKSCDFVSRMFAPAIGIDEDPVTGSAHTILTPYWSKRLGKVHLLARQISERGGELHCKMSGDRVEIGGHAVTYLTGHIEV